MVVIVLFFDCIVKLCVGFILELGVLWKFVDVYSSLLINLLWIVKRENLLKVSIGVFLIGKFVFVILVENRIVRCVNSVLNFMWIVVEGC